MEEGGTNKDTRGRTRRDAGGGRGSMDLARSREPAPSAVRFATAEGGREAGREGGERERVAGGLWSSRVPQSLSGFCDAERGRPQTPSPFLPSFLTSWGKRERKAHSALLAHGHGCVVASPKAAERKEASRTRMES